MINWLLRAKRWAQNPPSMKKVYFVLAIVGICVALAGFEHFFGWPEALTPNGNGRGRMLRP